MESPKTGKPTELLVIGTIHFNHWTMPGYSPGVLKAIIDRADPDALCLEILPGDFEPGKWRGPVEMEAVGVKWAEAHNRPWYPMDWGPNFDVRQERAKAFRALSETPEGRAKIQKIEEFGTERVLIEAMSSWPKTLAFDYRAVNSPAFCDHQRAGWDLIVSLLGDGVESLMWRLRNREMTKLIELALEKHPGQRVAVLTGSGHKYWFDDYFRRLDGVRVLSIDDIGDIEPQSPADRRSAVRNGVWTFMESMVANSRPESLETEGLLETIDTILEESPDDLAVWYSKGRTLYVLGDYEAALDCYRKASSDPEFRVFSPFDGNAMLLYPLAVLRKGHMLDLLGRREEAIQAYRELAKVDSGDRPWGKWAESLIQTPFSRRVR